MNFDIVLAVTEDYLKRLQWSLPTWAMKPQFKDKRLLVFYRGFSERKLRWIRKIFPKAEFFESETFSLDAANLRTNREWAFSTYIFGAAEHVKASHYVKLDADCFFTSDADAFTPDDFDFDLCAHRWGYTKPAWWIDALDAWLNAKPFMPPQGKDGEARGAGRIISWCCLHKTAFVQAVTKICKGRLPIPSHDTTLWYIASQFSDLKWRAVNLKKRGVDHCKKESGLREQICAHGGAWNPIHNEGLMRHLQMEVTRKCNLACPNCDRACPQAPSDECLSLEQLGKFFAESADHEWRRLDIIGGEPTLYPHLGALIQYIEKYRVKFPWCKVRLTTNGTKPDVIAKLPAWIQVRNSSEEKKHPVFGSAHLAPFDAGIKRPLACSIPWRCGIALTPFGYFPCGAGAAVARVFGAGDAGLCHLADVTPEALRSQMMRFCSLCGHSLSTCKRIAKQETSKSWAEAFERFKAAPPKMTAY